MITSSKMDGLDYSGDGEALGDLKGQLGNS